MARGFDAAFAARLAAKARHLARARAETRLARRSERPERRWRQARLLWPLFARAFGSST